MKNKKAIAKLSFLLIAILVIASLIGCNNPNTSTKTAANVTVGIYCDNASKNRSDLKQELQDTAIVPENGVILEKTTVELKEGDTAFDAVISVCKSKGIVVNYSGDTATKSQYISSINGLNGGELGEMSGWLLYHNKEMPNVGCGAITLKDGDDIQFHYSLDFGEDVIIK